MIEQAIKAIESDYSHSPNGRHAHFVRFDVGEAKMYCYITEVADCLCDDGKFGFDSEKYAEAAIQVEDEELNELCSKLRDVGLKFYDCHLGNVGYLRGKLVCIDFGE